MLNEATRDDIRLLAGTPASYAVSTGSDRRKAYLKRVNSCPGILLDLLRLVGTMRDAELLPPMLRFLLGDKARLEYADGSSQRVQLAKEIRRALAAQRVVKAEATAWHSERTIRLSDRGNKWPAL